MWNRCALVAWLPAPISVTLWPLATSESTRSATTVSIPPYASGGTLKYGGATIAMWIC